MNAKLQEMLASLTPAELGQLKLYLEEKAMLCMVESVVSAAAILQERDKWLVIKVKTAYSGDKLAKIRIADIKDIEEWDNGLVSLFGINDSPTTEDYGCQTMFKKEEWATRRIMTTMEVLGL